MERLFFEMVSFNFLDVQLVKGGRGSGVLHFQAASFSTDPVGKFVAKDHLKRKC